MRPIAIRGMVICPICSSELVPWLVPMEEAPWVLGVSPEELEELIEMDEIMVRINLSNSPPTEMIDMRTVRNLPMRVHETMKHEKPRCIERVRGSQRHTCRIHKT